MLCCESFPRWPTEKDFASYSSLYPYPYASRMQPTLKYHTELVYLIKKLLIGDRFDAVKNLTMETSFTSQWNFLVGFIRKQIVESWIFYRVFTILKKNKEEKTQRNIRLGRRYTMMRPKLLVNCFVTYPARFQFRVLFVKLIKPKNFVRRRCK